MFVPVADSVVDVLISSVAVDKNPAGVIQIGRVIDYSYGRSGQTTSFGNPD